MNLCDEVSQEERNKAVDSYTDRLIRSGYSISQVRDIIVSGLTGYERKKLKAAKEKAPLHQPAATTQLKICLHKKLTEKENWYKLKRKQQIEKQKKGQVINNVVKQVPVPVVSVMQYLSLIHI